MTELAAKKKPEKVSRGTAFRNRIVYAREPERERSLS